MPARGPQVGSAHVRIYPEYDRTNLNRTLAQITDDIKKQSSQANAAWAQSTKASMAEVQRNIAAARSAESKAVFARLAEERKAARLLDQQRQSSLAAHMKAVADANKNSVIKLRAEVDVAGFRRFTTELHSVRTTLRQLDRAIPSPFASLGLAVAAALPLLVPLIASLGKAATVAAAGIPAMVGFGTAALGVASAFKPVQFALSEYSNIQDKVTRGTLTAAEGQAKWNQILAASPASTRPMIQQLAQMNTLFNQLGETFRVAAFPGLTQFLKDAVSLFPLVNAHVKAVGASIGVLAIEAGKLVKSPLFQSQLAVMLEGSRVAFDRLTQAVLPAVQAIMSIGTAATPVLVAMANWVTEVVKRFAAWIEIKRLSGELAEFFRSAWTEAQKWLEAAVHVGLGLANIFGAALPTGQKLSQTILEISIAFERWTKANTAQLQSFFETLRTLPWGSILKGIGSAVAMTVALQGLSGAIGAIDAISKLFVLIAAGGVAGTLAAISAGIIAVAGGLTLLYLNSEKARVAINALVGGFAKGFMDVWNGLIKPMINEMKVSWEAAIGSISRILSSFGLTWKDVGRIVGATVAVITALLLGPFVVAAKAGELAWKAIGVAFDLARAAGQKLQPVAIALVPGFRLLGDTVRAIPQAFIDLYQKSKPFLDLLGAEVRQLWEQDIKPSWDSIRASGASIFTTLRDAWNRDLKPVFLELKNLWDTALKPSLQELGTILKDDLGPTLKTIGGLLLLLGGSQVLANISRIGLIFRVAAAEVSRFATNIKLASAIISFLSAQIQGSLKTIVGLFQKMGEDSIRGFIRGIFITPIGEQVLKWVNSFVGWFKRLLGIKSPSTVFMSIGQDIVRGLIEGIKSLGGDVLKTLAGIFPSGAIKDLGKKIGGAIGGLLPGKSARFDLQIGTPDFSKVQGAIGAITNTLANFSNWFGGAFLSAFNSTIGRIITSVRSLWIAFRENVGAIIQIATALANYLVRNVAEAINIAVARMITGFKSLWISFRENFGAILTTATGIANFFIRNVATTFSTAAARIITGFKSIWIAFRESFEALMLRATGIANWFSHVFALIFQLVSQKIMTSIRSIWIAFRENWNAILQLATGIANFFIRNVAATFAIAGARMITGFRSIWIGFRSNFNAILIRAGIIRDGVTKAFNTLRDNIGNAFGALAGLAQKGINALITILNKAISLINKILPKSLEIKGVGTISTPRGSGNQGFAAANRRAQGGRIYGPGTPTSDSIFAGNAWVSRDEYVIKAKTAKKVGYSKLDYLNAYGELPGPGHKNGGRVVGLAYGGRVPGDGSDKGAWRPLTQLYHKLGGTGGLTSGYRPGDPLWHGQGYAADLGGYNQDTAAGALFSKYGGALLELIHKTNSNQYNITRGKSVSMDGQTNAEHRDHIHVAADTATANAMLQHARTTGGVFKAPGAGFGMGNPLAAAALKLFNKLMKPYDKLLPKGDGINEKAVNKIMSAPRDYIRTKLSSEAGGAGAGGAAGGGKLGSWINTAMQIAGVPASWAGPLRNLIMRESGGNPNAINRWDINARNGDPSRGLMQTIGATFRQYRDPRLSSNIYDPIANIVAGLRYIKARYGSIFNVQQAVGSTPRGYADGVRGAKPGLAWVGERGPELVDFRGGETVYNAKDSMMLAGLEGYARGTSKSSTVKQILMSLWRNVDRLRGSAKQMAQGSKAIQSTLRTRGYYGLARGVSRNDNRLIGLGKQRDNLKVTQKAKASYAKKAQAQYMEMTSLQQGGVYADIQQARHVAQMQAKTAQEWARNLSTVRKKGGSSALIQQLIQAGPESNLAGLLANASKANVKEFSGYANQNSKAAIRFGRTMADAVYGALSSKQLQRDIKNASNSVLNAVRKGLGLKPISYDNGGPVPPGQVFINNTGRTEMMLNNAQGNALTRRIEGSGSGVVQIHNVVEIDGSVIDARIDEYDSRTGQLLRAGRRK